MPGISHRRKQVKADKERTKLMADELENALRNDIQKELKADEAKLTHKEREEVAQAERRAKFNATYIRRSEAEINTRNAISIMRTNLVMVVLFIVILPLATIAYVFHKQSNEKISCNQLAESSINYLESSGEVLPAGCNTSH